MLPCTVDCRARNVIDSGDGVRASLDLVHGVLVGKIIVCLVLLLSCIGTCFPGVGIGELALNLGVDGSHGLPLP